MNTVHGWTFLDLIICDISVTSICDFKLCCGRILFFVKLWGDCFTIFPPPAPSRDSHWSTPIIPALYTYKLVLLTFYFCTVALNTADKDCMWIPRDLLFTQLLLYVKNNVQGYDQQNNLEGSHHKVFFFNYQVCLQI